MLGCGLFFFAAFPADGGVANLRADPASARTSLDQLVPKPTRVIARAGVFTLDRTAQIVVPSSAQSVERVALTSSGFLRSAAGYPLPVVRSGSVPPGSIALRIGGPAALGDEGYQLTIAPRAVTAVARKPAGLFYGMQTLRQLLTAAAGARPASGALVIRAASIRDVPRFRWRGAMLDVARHFFAPRDVAHFIDAMAAYKLNRLHLHLSDDQGWRIAIAARPRLTARGATTAVGGGRGGYYTQAEYRQLVAYARRRFVTIVAEVDMPGHSTAALASYGDLTCSGKAPALFTGIGVTGNSLCVG